jgi:hypothetical protein
MTTEEVINRGIEQKASIMMGERYWTAQRAALIEHFEKPGVQAGFFRVPFDPQVDLSDVVRLILFNQDWQLQAIREPGSADFIVCETVKAKNELETTFRTIKAEADRFEYADRLGVLSMIPKTQEVIVQSENGTWRLR